MKRVFAILLALVISSEAIAAATPSYSPKFGNAIAGVIQEKVTARGFAANDPRFIATEVAIGTALSSAAASLVAAAGLPLWATIAVGAVAAGAISLGINSATQWLFNSDSTITPTTASVPAVGAPIQGGDSVFSISFNGVPHYSSDPVALWKDQIYFLYGGAGGYSPITFSPLTPCSGSFDGMVCLIAYGVSNGTTYQLSYKTGMYRTGTVPAGTPSCSAGYITGTTCGSPSYMTPPPPTPQAISSAVANVPDSDMALPANPALVAQAANKWWQQVASQPGYQGMPYVASDPVTAADVSAYQSANPSSYPTVGDMLAPAVNPATGTVAQPVAPGTQPQPGVNPGTNTAPAGTPQVNLGTDPVVPLPTLETTPTAQMILNPLLGLFPDLKSFVVPSHSAECPKPSLSLFGRTMVMDGHCTLLESVRPTIYAVMAAVWVMVGLFIILAA